MYPLLSKIYQSELLKPGILEILLELWYDTHLYEPTSLGEILEEVIE
jgi:hypothetical protein